MPGRTRSRGESGRCNRWSRIPLARRRWRSRAARWGDTARARLSIPVVSARPSARPPWLAACCYGYGYGVRSIRTGGGARWVPCGLVVSRGRPLRQRLHGPTDRLVWYGEACVVNHKHSARARDYQGLSGTTKGLFRMAGVILPQRITRWSRERRLWRAYRVASLLLRTLYVIYRERSRVVRARARGEYD